jgi:hypothetical protein
MPTAYDVCVWSTNVYRGARTTSCIVQWKVGDHRWKARFKTRALADGFRSELVTATRQGEAFDVATGRPVSGGRAARISAGRSSRATTST